MYPHSIVKSQFGLISSSYILKPNTIQQEGVSETRCIGDSNCKPIFDEGENDNLDFLF